MDVYFHLTFGLTKKSLSDKISENDKMLAQTASVRWGKKLWVVLHYEAKAGGFSPLWHRFVYCDVGRAVPASAAVYWAGRERLYYLSSITEDEPEPPIHTATGQTHSL